MPGMQCHECPAAHTGVLKELSKNNLGSMSDDTKHKRRHHVQMVHAGHSVDPRHSTKIVVEELSSNLL